jgi:geranylgeranyl diphosphate synthase type II
VIGPASSLHPAGLPALDLAAIERTLAALTAELLDDAPASIAEPIRYAAGAGGKRIRPLLCVAAYRALARPGAEETPDPSGGIYGVAAAVELIHCYSLVHDDLPCMDDDDLRRGRPATHRAFDVGRATAAGAAMIALASLALARAARALGLPPAECSAMTVELCAAAGAGGMVGGQFLDLESEGQATTLADLERLHRRKTGALLSAAVTLGGRAARADANVLEALAEFGQGIGLAFQIADDILDVTATSAVLGKTAGRDEQLAKATFPAVLGLEAARRRADEEVDAAIAALHGAGVAATELESLARFVVDRKK